MTRRQLQPISTLALFISVLITLTVFTRAQNSASHDDLIKEIEHDAEFDAKAGRPTSIESLQRTYGGNTAGLTDRQIKEIYQNKYTEVQKTEKEGSWRQYLSANFWTVLLIAGLTLLLQQTFGKMLHRLANSLWNEVYKRGAGNSLIRRYALNRYRSALFANYTKVPVAFRPNEKLELHDVYVPVMLTDTSGSQLDAYQASINHQRLIVMGPPGAGKSMLLKSILLSYAARSLGGWPNSSIPVLVELYRLNDPNSNLYKQLVDELERNDFPRSGNFVTHNLKNGRLLLLLDGFDEVRSSERARVTLEINNFLKVHRRCRAIITSRKSIDLDEFNETIHQRLEILDFNNYQIQKFLRMWALPADRSAEQLMNTLENSPQIMSMARNPLLLTMIAFLYKENLYPLPHSRAVFYQQSIDLLLQLKKERVPNRFHSNDKSLVLEAIAYTIHSDTQQDQRDSRSLDHSTILGIISDPSLRLTLDAKNEPDALIKEIEDRSGLLISIDGGRYFQFSHRSFQEFFTAEKLKSNMQVLSEIFQADPDTWREPLKLWCGLPRNDCTLLLKRVMRKETLTAFECLADAELVNADFADQVINSFKSRLQEADQDDNKARAFGLVAASQRPRGIELFNFLEQALINTKDSVRRRAAAKSLSYTDLPHAATLLASQYDKWNDVVRGPLTRMGDIAIRNLEALVKSDLAEKKYITKYVLNMQDAMLGKFQEEDEKLDDMQPVEVFIPPKAMDDLQVIGTPQSALVLADLLWSSNEGLAASAAWRLTAMLARPDVEDALKGYKITAEMLDSPQLSWVWQPFAKQSTQSLMTIAGRIAYLIDHAPWGTAPVPVPKLDARLAIPLCAIKAESEMNLQRLGHRIPADLARVLIAILRRTGADHNVKATLNPNEQQVRQGLPDPMVVRNTIFNGLGKFREYNGNPDFEDLQRQLINKLCEATEADERWRYLLLGLQPQIQREFLRHIARGPMPTLNDWITVFERNKYRFETGWHYRLMTCIAAILSLIASIQLLQLIRFPLLSDIWKNTALLIASLNILGVWYAFWKSRVKDPEFLLKRGILGSVNTVIEIRRTFKDVISDEGPALALAWVVALIIIFALWLPVIGLFSTMFMLHYVSGLEVLLIWLVIIIACVTLYSRGRAQHRAALNPLRGILDYQSTSHSL